MSTAGPTDEKPNATEDVFGEVIQLTYATVAQPEKFHDLIALWERCITDRVRTDSDEIENGALVSHFNQALQIFDQIGRVRRDHDRARRIMDAFSLPAFICDTGLNILHKNTALDEFLEVEQAPGSGFGDSILRAIRDWGTEQTISFVPDVGLCDDPVAAVVTELPQNLDDGRGDTKRFLVVFNDVSESHDALRSIQDKYGLTPSERDVLGLLVKGKNADAIAQERHVSINTIRAHIRGLLEKTGSRTQNDLIRSSVFVMTQFQSLRLVTQAILPNEDEREPASSRVILPSGRMLHFRQYGTPDGLPVLYLHGMMSGPQLPVHVQESAARHGLRIIAPSRPGFGKSDSIPATDWEFVRQACRDLYAFLDVLSLPSVFVIGNLSAAGIALNFADRFPERCVAVLNTGFGGVVNDTFFDGMGTMSRAFARSYQKSRTALRFLTRAGIASVDFLGAHRMIQRHLGQSPIDLEYCQQTGSLDMMADGLTHALRQGGDAFMKDGFLATYDWQETIESLKGRVPLHCFLGRQDGISPHDGMADILESIENYDVRFFPTAGQLVLFQVWDDVVALILRSYSEHRTLPRH